MLDEAEMKGEEDLSPGSISAGDVKTALRALSEPQETQQGPGSTRAGDGLSRGRKENIFQLFSSISPCSV